MLDLFFNKVNHVYFRFWFTSYFFSRIQTICKVAAVKKKIAIVIAKHLSWSSLSLRLETKTSQ